MSRVVIKIDDEVMFEGMSRSSFETEDVNIEVEHLEDKGFTVSIYDRIAKIMCFYRVVDGKLKLYSIEKVPGGEEMMLLRDDIKDKVFDLITASLTDPKFRVHEHFTWIQMTMDAIDVQSLADAVIIEFELDSIEFSEVMKWETVKDIVNYIETALEDKSHEQS